MNADQVIEEALASEDPEVRALGESLTMLLEELDNMLDRRAVPELRLVRCQGL